MQISAWLLDKWPQRLVEHCTEHEIWSSALTKDIDRPPAWYLSVIQENLKRSIWKGKAGSHEQEGRKLEAHP